MSAVELRFLNTAIAAVLILSSIAYADTDKENASSSLPTTDRVFLLININSGRCLAVSERSKDAGANVAQGVKPETASNAEQWKLIKTGDYFRIMNQNSGKMLSVPKGSKRKGTQIIQWESLDSADQQWQFVKVGNHYSVLSRVSGLVLGVAEASKDDGTVVVQWNMEKIPDQLWFLRQLPLERK
nr:putative integron gene cassette protein [uncultured bacterium]